MERVAGFEPASSAWKAEVLPLNDTRIRGRIPASHWEGLMSYHTHILTAYIMAACTRIELVPLA